MCLLHNGAVAGSIQPGPPRRGLLLDVEELAGSERHHKDGGLDRDGHGGLSQWSIVASSYRYGVSAAIAK